MSEAQFLKIQALIQKGSEREAEAEIVLLTHRVVEKHVNAAIAQIEAAGAKEVLSPIFGMPTAKKLSDLDYVLEGKVPAGRVECMAFHPLGSAKMATTPGAGVVKPTGETWAVENLFVCDGSILPTSIGVNSQLPIMAVALRVARQIVAANNPKSNTNSRAA